MIEVLRAFLCIMRSIVTELECYLQYESLTVQVDTSEVPPMNISETVPSRGSDYYCKGTHSFHLLSLTPEFDFHIQT